VTLLERHLEDPVQWRRIKRFSIVILSALAVSEAAATYLFELDHAHFWFENVPAWGSLYGLASCIAIIVVSKLLGKLWLTRPEDYYDS
jgi:hypothetical protein